MNITVPIPSYVPIGSCLLNWLSTDNSLSYFSFMFLGLLFIGYTVWSLNKMHLLSKQIEMINIINKNLDKRLEKRHAQFYRLFEQLKVFRVAFEGSDVGIALISNEGRWLKVNKKLCNMLGYTKAEFLYKSIWEITHPDDLDNDLREKFKYGKIETYRVDKRLLHKDGSVVCINLNMSLVKDNQARPRFFVSRIENITQRNKTQQKIIESETILKALFDHVEGAVCLINTNKQIINYNKVFVELCKILTNQQPLIGEELYSFFPSGEKKDIDGVLEQVLNGQKEVFEVNYHRNIKQVFLRISLHPVIIKGEVFAISLYAIDLTSSKESEIAVRKANARFRAIVENTFDGITLLDQRGNAIYRSPSIELITGWTDEDRKNQRDLEYVHPEDLSLVEKAFAEGLKEPEKSTHLINRIKHKKGHYIWTESFSRNKLQDPDLGAIITVFRDITERKKAEDELRKSELRYRLLIEQASDAIMVTDQVGNFLNVNTSFCKLFGYTKEELLGHNISMAIDSEQFKNDPIRFDLLIADQAIIRERKMVHKNGTIIEVEANVKKLPDGSILAIARDITERKKTEMELCEAEAKFRSLVVKSMVGVYIIQDGKFTYVNPRITEMFGYDLQELINANPIELLIAADERNIVAENLHACLQDEKDCVHYEVKGKKKDGQLIYIEVFGSITQYKGNPACIGSFIDITERKNAAELIIKEKGLSDSIINSLPGVFYLHTQTGEYLRWNKNLEIMSGYTAAEIRNTNAYHLIAAEDRELIKENIEKVFKKGHAAVEAHVVTKNGENIPFYLTGVPVTFEDKLCLLGTGLDISTLVKTKEALQKSEANLQTIFNTTDTAYVLVNHKLRVISFNQGAASFAKKELKMRAKVGDYLGKYFLEEKWPQLEIIFLEVLQGKQFKFDTSYSQSNGSMHWYRIKLFPISKNKREIFGLMLSICDVTERKNAEIQRERITVELIQRNKDLEQFAYIISHNLRAPVANIIGLSEELNDESHSDEMQKIFIKELSSSIKRLDNVIIDINHILQVKREICERKEPVNLSNVVDNIQSSIRDLITQEKVLIKSDFSEIDEFSTLKSYLYSIFYNLISNSIKFRQPDTTPVIEIDSKKLDNKLLLTFKDNGMGIDLEKKSEQIFGLYKRFHLNIEGKGMGLFMVKTQVEILGGTITINSQVNVGTEFLISFHI